MLKDSVIYRGKIKDWGLGESSKKGTPYFEVEALITHEEDEDNNPVALENPVRRVVTMYLTGGSLPITAATLRSFGYDGKTLARLHPAHPEAFSFKDKEVRVSCRHEPNSENGRLQEKLNILRQSRFKLEELGAKAELDAQFAAAMSPKEVNEEDLPAELRD